MERQLDLSRFFKGGSWGLLTPLLFPSRCICIYVNVVGVLVSILLSSSISSVSIHAHKYCFQPCLRIQLLNHSLNSFFSTVGWKNFNNLRKKWLKKVAETLRVEIKPKKSTREGRCIPLSEIPINVSALLGHIRKELHSEAESLSVCPCSILANVMNFTYVDRVVLILGLGSGEKKLTVKEINPVFSRWKCGEYLCHH